MNDQTHKRERYFPISFPSEEDQTTVCLHCEDALPESYQSINAYGLCQACDDKYDNKTGYCSLHCCITGECDGAR